MTDLDYALTIGRFGLEVGDTPDDPDKVPDVIWCDQGTVRITPLITFTKVVGGTPRAFTMAGAVIDCQISQDTDPEGDNYYSGGAGYLLYNGDPYVYVVDLTSTKVNPRIADEDAATHRVQFIGVQADGTDVPFPTFTCRLTAEGDGTTTVTISGSPVPANDLAIVAPVIPGTASPITRGVPGIGVADAAIIGGTNLQLELTDGSTVDAGELPVGPGGSNAGVAGYISNPGPTQDALSASIAEGVAPTAAVASAAQQGLPFLPCQHISTETLGVGGITPLDSIGGYLYGRDGTTLKRATSEVGPWTTVETFGGTERVTAIRETGDGEVVVAQRSNGVWKSSGWAANPLTATWTKVLTTNAPVELFSINTEPGSGRVGVTTYISGADMSLSRYIWLSTDHGQTFSAVYDKTVAHPEVTASTSHMHHISFDPYWDGSLGYRPDADATQPRIWAVWHKTSDDPTVDSDPKNIVMFSDDDGATWTEYTTTDHHGVVAVATPGGMVMDTDYAPVSLWVIPRGETVSDMPRRILYRRRPTAAALNTTWGWGARGVRGADGAAHVVFRSSIANFPAGIVTSDGTRADETLTINPTTSSDAVDVVGLALHDGRLLASTLQTVSAPSTVVVVKADEPVRGAQAPEDNGMAGGAAGDSSVAVGKGASATVNYKSVAVGHASSVTGREGVAVGQAAVSALLGVAVGAASQAGQDTVAVGKGAGTASPNAVVIGSGATGVSSSTVIGKGATGNGGSGSVTIGLTAVTAGARAVAIGLSASAAGADGVALGNGATVGSSFGNSVALGAGSSATAADQVQINARHIELRELSADPAAPVANTARFYLRDNGSAKSQLCVRFPTGAVAVLATEP